MTVNEYQQAAARTINPELDATATINHAVFGLNSEAGEIAGIYQKIYQKHPIDFDALQKEIGDAAWFLAELCTAYGWSLEVVLQKNIDKLKKRYPDGFSGERSLHRPEYAERTESGLTDE